MKHLWILHHLFELVGVKELAFMMNHLELRSICDDFIKVEYKEGTNRNNKMVLSKRFMESFEDVSLQKWFRNCNDKKVLATLCNVMGLSTKASTAELQSAAVEEIQKYGEQVILHRLNVDQLREICCDLRIKGYTNTSSKKILVESILTHTDIQKRQVKRTKVTKKVAINKATEPAQLAQHYKAMDLEAWCRDNGLKTSGTKKVLVARIIAYNNGEEENDEENVMTTVNKTKPKRASLPAKKNTSKKTKKPEPEPEPEPEEDEEDEEEEDGDSEQPEEEEDDNKEDEEMDETPEPEAAAEESYDEEAEEAAIAAERALRTDESSESELLVESSECKENEYPTDIEGLSFAISGNFTRDKTEIKKAIAKGKGTITNKLNKKVIYVAGEGAKSLDKIKAKGIQIVGEEYFTNFY